MSIRLNCIELMVNDVNNGILFDVVEHPETVDDVRDIIATLINEIEDQFGYQLGFRQYTPKRVSITQ